MSMKLSPDDLAIVNEIGALASALWKESEKVVGLNTSPEMHSIMLFRRLWSNHRGFLLLWQKELQTEAATILRSGLEVAICLAANAVLRERFVALVREDAVETLKRQIKIWRDEGWHDMVRDYEATLRAILKTLPSGAEPKALDWGKLARESGVSDLYGLHRALSGQIAHVTGLSLIRGVVGEDMEGKDAQDELTAIRKASDLMMMAGTTLRGCKVHAAVVNATALETTSDNLIHRSRTAHQARQPASTRSRTSAPSGRSGETTNSTRSTSSWTMRACSAGNSSSHSGSSRSRAPLTSASDSSGAWAARRPPGSEHHLRLPQQRPNLRDDRAFDLLGRNAAPQRPVSGAALQHRLADVVAVLLPTAPACGSATWRGRRCRRSARAAMPASGSGPGWRGPAGSRSAWHAPRPTWPAARWRHARRDSDFPLCMASPR
jgi:hypothetical protein